MFTSCKGAQLAKANGQCEYTLFDGGLVLSPSVVNL